MLELQSRMEWEMRVVVAKDFMLEHEKMNKDVRSSLERHGIEGRQH